MEYVTVAEEQSFRGTSTASDGSFSIRLPAGKNELAVSYVGYRTIRQQIEVRRGMDPLKFVMQPEALDIAEVVVTAQSVDSDKGTSAYRVDNQAIQQIQAMNLSDVLSLLPGNKIGASNFNSVQQPNIRSAITSDYNNFGTSVIVNGMTLNNDANMQTSNPAPE